MSTNTVNQLQVAYHFPTQVYFIDRPDFLESVLQVSEELLIKRRKEAPLDEIYPAHMSDNYYADQRVAGFSEFIGATAWNILQEQGYATDNLTTTFTEMWSQEHHKHSLMEQHTHGFGAQIVGFYFLECPENCSKVVVHDPRPARVQIALPEQNMALATPASSAINFTPEPGKFIFMNAWLPHSFSRHASDKPLKFVHFNLTAQYSAPKFVVTTPQAGNAVEVV